MKKASKYKALYQMSRQHRAKEVEILRNVDDSLDNIPINSHDKTQSKNSSNYLKPKNHKKGMHMRSQSCPFMNPTFKNDKTINQKNSNNQNKKTLKKASMKHYVQRKDKKTSHKYSNSHLSQDSSTVIVHNIPIEQLSSMLYSRNVGKEKIMKKLDSSRQIHTSVSQSNILSCLHAQTDLYFQTQLQQQMKIYQLNEDLKNLQRESLNVKVKQKVLESLAGKFDYAEKDAYQTVVIH